MGRHEALTAHLPHLYREGPLVSGLTATWAIQLDLLDEGALTVQRAHWFDVTPDDAEAAALAALLDIVPEEFHADLREFRPWVHALRDGVLRGGSVTREALRVLVDRYVRGFQAATAIRMVPPIDAWAVPAPGGAPARAVLHEHPSVLRAARLPATGAVEPLARLHVTNRGIDPAPWAVVLTGTGGGAEYAPFLANRTTGDAVVLRGRIGLGQVLVIAPRGDDRSRLRAELDGVDVTDRLDTYPALVTSPGGPGQRSAAPEALHLARGDNELWFLPLAHYDTPGLDRYLLALAGDALRTGRFDQTDFDAALFAQPPEVSATLLWVEATPASLEVQLPGWALMVPAGGTDAGCAARERLRTGLDVAVADAAAAGVATEVVLATLTERQPARDRLVVVLPRTFREAGPTGADRITDASGTFGVTGFDDSTLT
jgi:hypothetical protein